MKEDEVLKNGVIGGFGGWRIHGKSYNSKGKLIDEVHDADCFCCKTLLSATPSNKG